MTLSMIFGRLHYFYNVQCTLSISDKVRVRFCAQI